MFCVDATSCRWRAGRAAHRNGQCPRAGPGAGASVGGLACACHHGRGAGRSEPAVRPVRRRALQLPLRAARRADGHDARRALSRAVPGERVPRRSPCCRSWAGTSTAASTRSAAARCSTRTRSIKKALIGYRGAWAAFGIEFNFPVSHNWMSMSPVDFAPSCRTRTAAHRSGSANVDPVFGSSMARRAAPALRAGRCSSSTRRWPTRATRATATTGGPTPRCRSKTTRG